METFDYSIKLKVASHNISLDCVNWIDWHYDVQDDSIVIVPVIYPDNVLGVVCVTHCSEFGTVQGMSKIKRIAQYCDALHLRVSIACCYPNKARERYPEYTFIGFWNEPTYMGVFGEYLYITYESGHKRGVLKNTYDRYYQALSSSDKEKVCKYLDEKERIIK